MKITNTQQGPRGLNTVDGAVLVEPRQTVDVELSEDEQKVAKATGWFTFGAKASDDEKAKPAAEKAKV